MSRAVDVGSTGTIHAPDRAQASQIAMNAGTVAQHHVNRLTPALPPTPPGSRPSA